MIPVILESPYSGHIHRNKAYLQLCILDAMLHGESPFAGHQMFTDALDDSDPVQRKQGMEAVEPWFQMVRCVVFYIDFGFSSGMKLGLKLAQEAGKLVTYRKIPFFNAAEFFTGTDESQDTPWEELFARHKLSRPAPARGACVIVIDKKASDGPFVLGLSGPKGIGLPGGRIEENETPLIAGVRELFEETGIEVPREHWHEFRVLEPRPTDNGDTAHGFAIDVSFTQGKLTPSKEGYPSWMKPRDLVYAKSTLAAHRVRFPVYNRDALTEVGLNVDDTDG